MTTEKQKLILMHLIRTNPELTIPYAEALTEAYAKGIDDGIKIANDVIMAAFKHG